MHKIIAFIPARKGSKGLKNKNFRKINGKSLLEITINSAKKDLPKEILVESKEDKKIAELKIDKKNKSEEKLN